MNPPKNVEVFESHARFVAEEETKFDEAVDRVPAVIRYCQEKKISRLLVDLTRLVVFRAPLSHERYRTVREWALEAGSSIALAVVAKKELIDPERFGLLVAENSDMRAFVSEDEAEAIAWLRAQEWC